MDSDFGRVKSSVSRVAASFTSLKAAVAGVVAGAAVKGLLDTATALDSMAIKMKFATGEASKASKEFAYVSQQAEKLGLDIKSSVDFFASFAAAARGTRVEGQGVREVWTAVAESAAVMQLSAEESEGAMRALTQIMSKGKVQAEELRGQLGERIPGAFQIAARAMDMTTQELDKFMAEGKLLAEDFLPKFAAQMRKEMAGSVGEAGETMRAELNRMSTAWLELQKTLLDVGLGDALKEAVKASTSAMQDLIGWIEDNEAAIDGLKQVIGELIDFIGDLIAILGSINFGFIDFLISAQEETDKAAEAMRNYGRDTKDTLEANTTNWSIFVASMGDYGRDVIATFKFMGKAIGEVFGYIVLAASEGFGLVVKVAYEAARLVTDAFTNIGSLLISVFTFDIRGIQDAMGSLVSDFQGSASGLLQIGDQTSAKLQAQFKALVKGIGDGLDELGREYARVPEFVEPTRKAVNKLEQAFDDAQNPELAFARGMEDAASRASELIKAMEPIPGVIDKTGKQSKKTMEDVDQFFRGFDDAVEDLKRDLAELQGTFDPEELQIEKWGEQLKEEFDKGVTDLYESLVELEQKLKKAKIVDPTILDQIDEERQKLEDLKKTQEDYNEVVDETVKAKKRLKQVQEDMSVAELNVQYKQLTGTIRDQITAENQWIDLKLEELRIQRDVTHKISAAETAMQEQIYLYQQQYNELRKTGSLLDGMAHGFRELGREMGTAFDLGVQLADDLYNAIGDVFDSVVKNGRDIEEVFSDMADAILAAIAKIATQQIIIPVIFDITGLGGLFGAGGSSSAAVNASVGAIQGGGSGGLGDLLGLGSLLKGDWLSGILGTELFTFGGGAGSTGSLGLLNAGFLDAANATNAYTFTLGSVITGLGGLASAAFGVMDLLEGDWLSGGGGVLGGGLMMASLIPGMQFLAPIGAAVSLLSSLFGGLFESEPRIEMDIGPEGWEIGGDIEDDAKAEVEKAIENYFDSLEQAFKVDIGQILRDNPDLATNWTIKGEDEIGEVTDLAGRWLDDFWRQYADAIADAVFGEGMGFNVEFFEGLGLSWYGMEEGELAEQITEIVGYLYALQEAGIDVNQALNDLKFTFFEAGGDPFEDLGDFFQNLQAEGEEIGATMARVISTLDIIPDGLERMAELVSGIDRSIADAWEPAIAEIYGAEGASAIIETIMNDLAAGWSIEEIMAQMESWGISDYGYQMVNAFAQALIAGIGEGMSEEEAYQLLENQLTFASELMMPAIDAALAAAIEDDFNLDTFEEAFIESMEASLVAALTQVAMDKIFNELIVSTFSDFGNLYDLIASYVAGDITAIDLTTGFTGIMDQLGPALEAISPIIEELFEVIQTFYTGVDEVVDDAENYTEWLDNLNNAFDASGIEAYVDEYEDLVKWRDDEIEALGKLETTSAEAAQGIARVLTIFYEQVQEILSDITGNWDVESGNEYQDVLDDLNEKYDETIDTLNELAAVGIDVSDAVDQVTESYQQQVNVIVGDLIRAIKDVQWAMLEWTYQIESMIADITQDFTQLASIASEMNQQAYADFQEAFAMGDYTAALGYLQNMIDASMNWYNAMVSQITAKYAAMIDAANAAADAARNAIEASYEAQIEAIEAEIDALDDLRDERQEYWEAEIDAVQELLDVAEAFARVVDQVHDQIMDMLLTEVNPTDEFERLAIAQSEVNRLMALWQGASGEERADYASELADALRDLLGLAGEAYPDVASSGYQQIYDYVLDALQNIQADAESQAASIEDLTQQLVDLNEAMEAELASIDDQQEALRDEIDALNEAMQDALDSIDSGVDELNEAMQAELDALAAQMVQHLEWIQELGEYTYEMEAEKLQQTLEGILGTNELLEAGVVDTGLLQLNEMHDINLWSQELARIANEQYSLTAETNRIGNEQYAMLYYIYQAISGLASYDVGTPYVPQTGLAMLHAGEAVIPAAYNNGGSSTSSGDINANITYAPVIQVSGTVDEKKLSAEMTRQFDLYLKHKGRKLLQDVASGRA